MDRLAGMRAFVVAADAGSFTAAADRLGTTPQAVSKLVAALEGELGSRLLARTTRRMHLTETGEAYLERARAVLADLEALEDDVKARRSEPAGVLRMSAPVSFGWLHLAEPVSVFLERHPKIEVRLELSDRRVNLVEEGFDLAVRIGPAGPVGNVVRKLATARMILAAAPGYLERNGRPTQPQGLDGHAFVLDTNAPRPDRWTLSDGEREVEVKVGGRLSVNSADAAAAAAHHGAGLLLGPDFVLGPQIRSGRLVHVLPGWSAGELPIHAVFPAARGLAPKVRLMVDHLAERFGGATPWRV